MKIWIVNHFAYSPDQSAGTRHYTLARTLQERNHKVLVIASSFYHKGREEIRLNPGEKYRREMLGGVCFQWLRTPPYRKSPVKRLWNMAVFAWRVYQGAWRNPSETPDVILGSSPSLPAAWSAQLCAQRLRVPFVMEIRDIWPDSIRDVGSLSRWNPIYIIFKAIERHLYRKADAIVTLLPKSFEHIIANGGLRSKITWIPNGVHLAEIAPLHKTQSRHPFTLIYFGAHGPYNGLEKVIDAAALLRRQGWDRNDLRIVLLGEGPLKAKLIATADQKAVGDLLEFRSAVPKSRLWDAIQDADAFLMIVRPMPSFDKGMSPNKLWDYLAAARPVLFSTVGGQALARESGAGISVTPGDAAALADGIKELWALSEEECQKMGNNGRAYVKNTADIPQLTSRLEMVLLSVLSGRANQNSQSSVQDAD